MISPYDGIIRTGSTGIISASFDEAPLHFRMQSKKLFLT